MVALESITKNEAGLSNSELDELLAGNSNWTMLWPIRQLASLGFIEYRVDLFGGPGRYSATELGRNALSIISGQLVQPKAPTPAPATEVSAPET
jgi:hypothetical protein